MTRHPRRYFAIPERAQCKRCLKPFDYGRRTKPRLYCSPCVELERQDHNDFHNALARRQRLAARMNAYMAHGAA